MDGWITIGTKIDTSQFDKQINYLDKKATDLTKEIQKNKKLNIDTSKAEASLEKVQNQIESLQRKQLKISLGAVKNIEFNTEPFENKTLAIGKGIGELSGTLKNFKNDTEYIATDFKDLQKGIEPVKEEVSEVDRRTKKVGVSMSDILKKVAKWTLAIFGVRSAYSAIRGAMSTLTQYDDQMATNLEYIRYALANALKPIIQWILDAVVKLLQYINYLYKAWFKKDLFASAKEFEKMKKSSGGIAKNVKEISKQLAGFDEMNVLQDTSSSASSSASGGGITSPNIDLTDDFKAPEWLEKVKEWGEWIIDHWPTILTILGITAGVLLGMKLASFVADLVKSKKGVEEMGTSFTGFFDGLGRAATAIAVLGGIALVIESITHLIEVFSDSGMKLSDVAKLLGIVLGGVVIAFAAVLGILKALKPSWESIAAAAVIFAGFAAVILSVSKLLEAMANSGMTVEDVGVVLLEIVGALVILLAALTVAGMLLQGPVLLGLAAAVLAIVVVLGALALLLPPILEACGDFIETIAPSVVDMIDAITEGIQGIIHALGEELPPIIQAIGEMFDHIFNGVSKVIDTVGNNIVKVFNSIGEMIDKTLKSFLNFINKLGPAVNNFVDNMIVSVTKLINFIVSAIEYLVNTLIVSGVNTIIEAINSISEYVGISISKVPEMNIPRFVPRLAAGGIISQPGRGVPVGYGQAIGGEAGREGVIPLDNASQMALIGEAIGKYVNINLTNVTKLDGRQIAREQKVVNAQSDFAYNR